MGFADTHVGSEIHHAFHGRRTQRARIGSNLVGHVQCRLKMLSSIDEAFDDAETQRFISLHLACGKEHLLCPGAPDKPWKHHTCRAARISAKLHFGP